MGTETAEPRHDRTFFRVQREHWLKMSHRGSLLSSLHFFLFLSFLEVPLCGKPMLQSGIYLALKGLKQRLGREVKRRLFSSVTHLEPSTAALLFFRIFTSPSTAVSRLYPFFLLSHCNKLSVIPYHIHSQNNDHFQTQRPKNGKQNHNIPLFLPCCFFIKNGKKPQT